MKKRVSLIVGIFVLLLCLCVPVSAATNTTKTTITTLTEKAEGKIYLSWSKKNVDGYQVRWALNSKMTGAKSASFTTTEMYRSGLIGGKTYYFQVRTYKKINGKKVYSNWSAMRSIRLKKLPPTTSITSLTANSSSKFTVKWNKKANVKGYQIRYSTDSSFKTKETASTNGTSITRSGLSKGTYYVSVRTYNIAADGTKYYSNWSGMKSVTLQEDLQKIFEKASGNYEFLNLTGRYTETLEIKRDGSFTGHVFEYSWSSGKYNGIPYAATHYYADYKGKFKILKKLNQYTYEIVVENLQDLTRNVKPYVEDNVLKNPINAGSLDEIKHMYFFVPGTPYRIVKQFIPLKDDYYKYLDDYFIGYVNYEYAVVYKRY